MHTPFSDVYGFLPTNEYEYIYYERKIKHFYRPIVRL